MVARGTVTLATESAKQLPVTVVLTEPAVIHCHHHAGSPDYVLTLCYNLIIHSNYREVDLDRLNRFLSCHGMC